jgi:hypothetical protein
MAILARRQKIRDRQIITDRKMGDRKIGEESEELGKQMPVKDEWGGRGM